MNKKTILRRPFLKKMLKMGSGALAFGAPSLGILNPRLLRADEPGPVEGFQPKDHYFVFYHFKGGWDVLLSLDPRDPENFTQANMGETGIYPAYERLLTLPSHGIYVDTELGPLGGFVGDLRLPKYTAKMCLIRGINMETLSHEAGFLRFMTGRMPEGVVPTRDSSDAVLAKLLGTQQMIPNISMGGAESVNTDGPSFATPLRAVDTSGFLANLTRDNGLDPSLESQISALLSQQESCTHATSSSFLTKAFGASNSVQQIMESDLANYFDFASNTEMANEIRSVYGFTSGQLGSVEALTALAEQALVNQVTRCVNIRVPFNFDTHYTLEQGPAQMSAYNSIARLMDRLEVQEFPDDSGDSWLDRTTIMCFSEFIRSPLLEQDVGRGHWLANCCLLAGGGIKTNQVLGGTLDAGMIPKRVDLQTGAFNGEGLSITPDNIIRALYDMLGYTWDVADLRVEPFAAILKDS